jgi:hypothetical protein
MKWSCTRETQQICEPGLFWPSSNFQCHQSSLGSSSSGSVCYVSEPQAGHFRFSSSRSSSIRCRRNVNLLERNVRLPLEMWLVALTEKPFCRIPFRRVTMRADAGSLDLDALLFLSAETVDSLFGKECSLTHSLPSGFFPKSFKRWLGNLARSFLLHRLGQNKPGSQICCE